ncbi:MAG: mandelate racemase/muconate lactonizing enzyme family protein [Beijerinckiaceae bacterium]
MKPIILSSIEAFAYRAPIATPIRLAFGTFRDRPLVLVRVVDGEGHEGFGEIWCNWPPVGAEHRARLAADVGERLIGQTFATPADLFHTLSRDLEVLVLQTGEVGPIAQVIAGIDIAVCDLAARREDLPLYRFCGGSPRDRVPVYATGINPDRPEAFALERQAEGHRAFKLKIGFGTDRDVRNLKAMRDALGPDAEIMADANQAFDLETALAFATAIDPLGLRWLEEPLRVDAPALHWEELARRAGAPLAGGENLRGDDLVAACCGKIYKYIQPDATKWGGVTGSLAVARSAVAAGKAYCPHVFGGGIALLASLHVLAAVGGDGTLELDCHPNAGREAIVGSLLPVSDGSVPVPQTPGLGATPDFATLERYRTWPPR